MARIVWIKMREFGPILDVRIDPASPVPLAQVTRGNQYEADNQQGRKHHEGPETGVWVGSGRESLDDLEAYEEKSRQCRNSGTGFGQSVLPDRFELRHA